MVTVLWSTYTHAILPTPALVSPTHGSSLQDVNVMLDWGASTGATFYEYKISTNATLIGASVVSAGANSYVNTSNLLFGTTYYWAVRAKSAADSSDWTLTYQFTTHDNMYQVSPTNGAVSQDVNVMLDWSAVAGITNYDVEFDTNAAFSSALHQYLSISSSSSSYTTSNLRFATKYFWRVRARHATDTTTWSTVWNFTTQDTIYLVSPANGALNQDVNVLLDWSIVNGITNYDVEFDTTSLFNSSLHQYQTITNASSSYNTSNLRFDTKYYWRIRAHHTTDTTSWSVVWNFTTLDTIYLVSPANGAINQVVNVLLDWSIVNGITNYVVEFDTIASFNSLLHQYQTITNASSSYNTSNLLFSTKYYWRVRAHHSLDTTSWSPIWNFTTTDGKPSHVSPANGVTGISLNPTIDWGTVSGILAYQYEYSVDSNFISASPVGTGTTSQAGLVSLSYGESYFWRVRCYHAVDTSDWSTPWKFTTLYQLTSPVLLSSPANGTSAIATSTVSLQWQTYASAIFYEYSYATNASFIGAVNGTTTSLSATTSTLSQGITYYWKVRANNGSGYSPWSTVWTFTTTGMGTPILLSPSNGVIGQPIVNLVFDWQDAAGGTFYEYQYCTDVNFISPTPVSSITTASTVSISGLSNNTTYYWRVRNNDGTTSSPWSTVWSFTTVGIGVPVLISPTNGAVSQPISNVVLDWQDAASASFYEYQYCTDVNFVSPAPTSATSTVSTATINGLAVNTTYYWRVRTSDGATLSAWSQVWSFTTSGLEIPTLVSPSNGALNQQIASLVLDWNNTSNTTFYEYQYSTDVQFVSPAPVSATSTVSSVIINGLNYNTTYYWRVRSNDGNGYSYWSSVWSFTTASNIGIDENVASFDLYPNPVKGFINLKFDDSDIRKISIYDVLGQQVWSVEVSGESAQIDLSMLSPGSYIVRVQDGFSIITKKITKQ